MRSLRAKLVVLALSALSMGAAMAQTWSASTVRIVVPYPPGTEPDVLARDMSVGLGKLSGKTFVVENRPGANSIIGTDAVAKGEGDGSVLLMVDRLAIVTNPMLYSKMPYRWEEALKPVSDVAAVGLYIGAREGAPYRTFGEFIAYAKAHPKKVNVGTGGNGHVSHIGMEMLAQAHGLSFNYVPYKGLAPAMQGMLGGEVDVVMSGGLSLGEIAKTGKVRLLVGGEGKRAMLLPDVPTLAEAGGKPGAIPSTAFSLFAPSKVPDAVVSQIGKAVGEVLAAPELKAKYASRALDVRATTPSELHQLLKAETAKYETIIRDAGIKVE
ncbi:tripartite tricarboxylate transporter substrate binding protein [Ramlibacter sp. AW1]|uniref:Tripartite tricarboxylate transporter substrate binding protein n=1 Tax=Ramlibacter aurantiacus TaxID=2801330 RepID=A0A937D3T5_9BURK|nr:tripartite tricarboxylate transporter substrate binding protein [Ramlibacter aurantiacus]MBL0419662.1 tripartite tricarboxylate transporter substrate binding protein [Ramlibacter aurantiacus]